MDSLATDPEPVSLRGVHARRLFFVMGFILATHTASPAQNVEKLIAKGDALRQQFDTHGAYESYLAAYAVDSANVDVLCRLSQELIEMGNELPKSDDQRQLYEQSLVYARKAVKTSFDTSKIFAVLGHAIEKKALYESGKVRIKLLNELYSTATAGIRSDSTNGIFYYLLGRWHLTMMDVNWLVKGYSKLTDGSLPEEPSYQGAEKSLLKAVGLSQEPISCLIELGKTYVRMENWHDARLAFEEIVFLSGRTKNDSRWKRDARKYLSMLEAAEYAPLKDAVEE